MKILFLTNNEITRPLYDWLVSEGEDIIYSEDKVTADDIVAQNVDLIISYNYRFLIKQDILSLLPQRVINLHISYLPWNRGADPNLWSFLENTPCGVTIHEIDPGIDTGDILIQEKLTFDFQNETLKSSYEKSHYAIQQLFRNHWHQIKNGKILPKKQKGTGSFHMRKDIAPYAQLINYDDHIEDFIQRIKNHGE